MYINLELLEDKRKWGYVASLADHVMRHPKPLEIELGSLFEVENIYNILTTGYLISYFKWLLALSFFLPFSMASNWIKGNHIYPPADLFLLSPDWFLIFPAPSYFTWRKWRHTWLHGITLSLCLFQHEVVSIRYVWKLFAGLLVGHISFITCRLLWRPSEE